MSPFAGEVGAVPGGSRTEAAAVVGVNVVSLPVVSICTCAVDAPFVANRMTPAASLRNDMCPAEEL